MKFLKASIKTAACPEETLLSAEEEKSFMNDLGHYAKHKGERQCLKKLYLFCKENDIHMPSQLLFRFGCCHDFNYEKAKKNIEKNHSHRYFSVKMDDELAEYMHENLVVLPLQGLKAKKGNSQVVFVRPSRFIPGPETAELFCKALAYTFNNMTLTEEDCRNGITILSYFRGYGLKNYQHDNDRTLVHLIDGNIIPIRINEILSVDAPKVYSKIMKMSKPLMTKSFAEKFKVIKSRDLGEYLMEDYEKYLPDDIYVGGWRSGEEIMEDFIDQSRFDEQNQ